MKKIISVILAAMLLLTVIPFAAFAADGATVTVTSSAATVCPGQPVTVTVSISGNPGYVGFALDLAIPQGFTYVSHTVGPVAPSTLQYNPANGFANCASATDVTSDGVIFSVTLLAGQEVSGSAVFGFDSVKMTANDLSAIAVVTASAEVSIAHQIGSEICKDQVCSACNAVVPGIGHQYGDFVYNNDATCTQDGTETKYCLTCGAAGETQIAVGSHNYIGSHVLLPYAHNCVSCGVLITACSDEDKNHVCDVCSTVVSACTDTLPADGYCDVCGKKLADCKDADNDHKCDDCGTVLSQCADADKDHNCDVCGKALSVCVDENGDDKCDYCEKDLEHAHDLKHTEAKAATCFEEGNLEYWYCAGCDCYFTDAEGKYNIAYLSLMTPVAHKIEHVEAKEPTETEDGNIEYWYCTECGYAWLDELCTKNTNLKAVVLPATGHVHNLEYTAAKAATCFEEGNLEYWYCAGCNCFFTDAEGKYNIAYLSLMTPVAHKIEHVAAVAPTATENGNIEYWYCTECGYAWLDELCTKNTNLKAVILPATGEDVPNPPTGDAASIILVALVASAVVCGAVISFKKREEN